MPSSQSEKSEVSCSGSLPGWDLGIVPPDKRRRTVFLPGKARCAVCGRGITDRDWRLYQTCDFWKCRAQRRQQQRTLRKKIDERERHQREKFERRTHLLRDKAAGLLGIDDPERFVPAVIPATQRPVTCLPQERRSALDDHLKSLIAEAHEKRKASPGDRSDDAAPTVALEANSKPLPIVQEACATCQGNCCISGGDNAYLTAKTIIRYSNEHPDLEPHEVRDAFLSHVEERTIENSCIYHGQNGCGLPRDARSTTCNEFECIGLRRLLKKLSGSGPHRVFLAAAEKNQVVRYTFLNK